MNLPIRTSIKDSTCEKEGHYVVVVSRGRWVLRFTILILVFVAVYLRFMVLPFTFLLGRRNIDNVSINRRLAETRRVWSTGNQGGDFGEGDNSGGISKRHSSKERDNDEQSGVSGVFSEGQDASNYDNEDSAFGSGGGIENRNQGQLSNINIDETQGSDGSPYKKKLRRQQVEFIGTSDDDKDGSDNDGGIKKATQGQLSNKNKDRTRVKDPSPHAEDLIRRRIELIKTSNLEELQMLREFFEFQIEVHNRLQSIRRKRNRQKTLGGYTEAQVKAQQDELDENKRVLKAKRDQLYKTLNELRRIRNAPTMSIPKLSHLRLVDGMEVESRIFDLLQAQKQLTSDDANDSRGNTQNISQGILMNRIRGRKDKKDRYAYEAELAAKLLEMIKTSNLKELQLLKEIADAQKKSKLVLQRIRWNRAKEQPPGGYTKAQLQEHNRDYAKRREELQTKRNKLCEQIKESRRIRGAEMTSLPTLGLLPLYLYKLIKQRMEELQQPEVVSQQFQHEKLHNCDDVYRCGGDIESQEKLGNKNKGTRQKIHRLANLQRDQLKFVETSNLQELDLLKQFARFQTKTKNILQKIRLKRITKQPPGGYTHTQLLKHKASDYDKIVKLRIKRGNFYQQLKYLRGMRGQHSVMIPKFGKILSPISKRIATRMQELQQQQLYPQQQVQQRWQLQQNKEKEDLWLQDERLKVTPPQRKKRKNEEDEITLEPHSFLPQQLQKPHRGEQQQKQHEKEQLEHLPPFDKNNQQHQQQQQINEQLSPVLLQETDTTNLVESLSFLDYYQSGGIDTANSAVKQAQQPQHDHQVLPHHQQEQGYERENEQSSEPEALGSHLLVNLTNPMQQYLFQPGQPQVSHMDQQCQEQQQLKQQPNQLEKQQQQQESQEQLPPCDNENEQLMQHQQILEHPYQAPLNEQYFDLETNVVEQISKILEQHEANEMSFQQLSLPPNLEKPQEAQHQQQTQHHQQQPENKPLWEILEELELPESWDLSEDFELPGAWEQSQPLQQPRPVFFELQPLVEPQNQMWREQQEGMRQKQQEGMWQQQQEGMWQQQQEGMWQQQREGMWQQQQEGMWQQQQEGMWQQQQEGMWQQQQEGMWQQQQEGIWQQQQEGIWQQQQEGMWQQQQEGMWQQQQEGMWQQQQEGMWQQQQEGMWQQQQEGMWQQQQEEMWQQQQEGMWQQQQEGIWQQQQEGIWQQQQEGMWQQQQEGMSQQRGLH